MITLEIQQLRGLSLYKVHLIAVLEFYDCFTQLNIQRLDYFIRTNIKLIRKYIDMIGLLRCLMT